MSRRSVAHTVSLYTVVLLFVFVAVAMGQAQADVVISQVYGGGGNTAATFDSDFIELHNRGPGAVDITGWSVQYASATGTSWSVTSLSVDLPPGGYYLIQADGPGLVGVPLPTPDATAPFTNIAVTGGKLALVQSTTALSGSCPTISVIDFVGWGGTVDCSEGSPAAPVANNGTSMVRPDNGCLDTDDNANDFSPQSVVPRNSSTAPIACFFGTTTTTTTSTTSTTLAPVACAASAWPSCGGDCPVGNTCTPQANATCECIPDGPTTTLPVTTTTTTTTSTTTSTTMPPAGTDIGVIPKKLIVVDKLTTASKAKLVYVSKDQAAGITKGTGTDPAQISVQFDVVYGNSNAAGAFTLPAGAGDGTAGWLVNKPTVAKYVNKTAPGGPTAAKVAVIKPGKLLKLVGKGLGDMPLDVFGGGDPGAQGVQTAYCVTNGGDETCHCSDFSGCAWKLIAGGTGAKLVCKTGTGDAGCSAVVPPTTTSTSTSTTTTTTPACLSTSGCFCDTGSTVIDTCTNLEWEKKDGADGAEDAGNLHDVDNQYAWTGRCTLNLSVSCQPNSAAAATCTTQTGGAFGCGECGVGEGTCDVALSITTVWDWVNQVNAASYAGHTDWRLPTSAGCCGFPTGEAGELESIVYLGAPGCGGGSPCIDSIFGPTLTTWSASTSSISPDEAWFLNFSIGAVISNSKDFDFLARAVRPSS